MKNRPLKLALAVAGILASIVIARAQEAPPPAREGAGGQSGENRAPARRNPLMTALDTNADGVLDEQEIAAASSALGKLDQNRDGKVTQDEVRPPARARVQGGNNQEAMVQNLMNFDKDGDGKLSKEELPERMRPMLESGDTNEDGFLDKEEMAALAKARSGGAPARKPGEEHERD